MDKLSKQQACQLFIEQEIEKGLSSGKTTYAIGKEVAQWIQKLFDVKVRPGTIKHRAIRMAKELGTNVPTDSTHEDEREIEEIQEGKFEHGGARDGAGRHPKFSVAPNQDHFRTSFTGENEWFTPIQYIESARTVLKTIDLDPASSPFGQKRVRATKHYTVKEDGLIHPWIGQIWLNPPYSQPLITNFITKLIEQINSGNTKEAILLTHNYTDTTWFHLAEKSCSLICFTKGRIRFEGESGDIASPTQGSAFFYYGSRNESFKKEFLKYGFIR